MTRHSNRGPNGRFTPSGAPIPTGDDHSGDTSAMQLGSDPSGDSLCENAGPMTTRYAEPAHNPALGAWQRPISQRRAVVIDARTGQQLSDDITVVRGIESMYGGREASHVVAAQGDPFVTELVAPPTGPDTREYKHLKTPRRLPPMGQSDRY